MIMNLQLFGSRGASSGRSKSGGGTTSEARPVSNLEMARENSRQLNQAMTDAKNSNAAILEYTDIMGKTRRYYWGGGRWEDRPSSLEARYGRRSGTFTAEFQEPDEWRRRR